MGFLLGRPLAGSFLRNLSMVATEGAYARAQVLVLQACEMACDERALRLQVLEAIRPAVPFDAHAWLLTDPETSVGAAPLANCPCLHELPRLIRLKYLTRVNRWTSLHEPPVGLLHQTTGGDLSRSRVWRELLAGYDVVDVASVAFRDRFGCWAFLDLWRSGTQAPFGQSDAHFLARVAAPIATALRRCQASTFVLGGARTASRFGPVVLLLSPDLRVHGQTPETHEYLSALLPSEPGRAPIPASAYNVGAQLIATEQGIDDNAPFARVHLADGHWLTLRAARLGSRGLRRERDIVITIEQARPGERVAVFTRAFGLSARENEVLAELATGCDTRELAHRLFLSEHTVQDHLKSIFTKTSTHNRRMLLSSCLGA